MVSIRLLHGLGLLGYIDERSVLTGLETIPNKFLDLVGPIAVPSRPLVCCCFE